MSQSKRNKKRKLRKRKINSKDHTIYMALKNPNQTTSVIDENGIKRWLDPYGFISTLHRSIKIYKKRLSTEKAREMIANYEMPAIQRCLQIVMMLNYDKGFDESDLHKYIAKKFNHITLEMLSNDYQTAETSKFKEDYDKLRNMQTDKEGEL